MRFELQVPVTSLTAVYIQVIPPGGTAKFTVTLAASTVQHYQQMVEYFVNGCHIFTFQV